MYLLFLDESGRLDQGGLFAGSVSPSIKSGRGIQPGDPAATGHPGTVLQLEAMEVRALPMVPIGLRRCDQCGEFRGVTYLEDEFPSILSPTTVSCLCEGIVCRHCRKTAIHRPISNYLDEGDERIWHVPWFAYLTPFDDCHER